MNKILRNSLFLLLAVAVSFLMGSKVVTVNAQVGNGSIWTTNGDCGDETQDVNHFPRGGNVYINGKNFNPGSYSWSIEGQPGQASCDPKIVVASSTVTVGESGAFCFNAYTVAQDDCGEYTVDVDNKNDNYRVEEGTPTPTATPTGDPGSPTPTPTATPTGDPGSPTPTPTATSTPSETPSPTPEPTNNNSGGTGGNSGGGSSSSSSSSSSSNAVLGASTLAKTGVIEDNLYTLILSLGFAFTAIAVRGYKLSENKQI